MKITTYIVIQLRSFLLSLANTNKQTSTIEPSCPYLPYLSLYISIRYCYLYRRQHYRPSPPPTAKTNNYTFIIHLMLSFCILLFHFCRGRCTRRIRPPTTTYSVWISSLIFGYSIHHHQFSSVNLLYYNYRRNHTTQIVIRIN